MEESFAPGTLLLQAAMIIESLELKNFRNYRELSLQLSPGTNLLYGPNAQGKTNVLEALFYCASARSHRGSKDREMIRFEESEAHIRLQLLKREVPYRVDIHLKKDRTKGIAINGVPIRRASELFGTVNAVLFSPEDLNLIKNGPSDRRRFMDLELCQMNRTYVQVLVQYNQALQQRNRLLKDLYFRPELLDTLDLWDDQLVRFGRELIRFRRRFVEELNPVISELQGKIAGGTEPLQVFYDASTDEDQFPEMLARSRETDEKLKLTSVGPHRDDLGFLIDRPEAGKRGMDLRKYGSQGQQRTAALALKLSEIALMKRHLGESPVLLLDDVLSELDENRQKQLLSAIEGVQTVITSTGMEHILKQEFSVDRIFEVQDGTIRRCQL